MVLANDRLIKIEDGQVFFRYKDYRDDNRWKTHQIPDVAFLSQLLQHILPRGLHNKRRYGFWGYHVRTENLARIRDQLGVPPVEVHHEEVENADEPLADGPRPRHCAICKAEMEYVGGTHRPSARRMMEFIWDDIVLAVDVHPEPRSVGFHPALTGQRSAPGPRHPGQCPPLRRRPLGERAGTFGWTFRLFALSTMVGCFGRTGFGTRSGRSAQDGILIYDKGLAFAVS